MAATLHDFLQAPVILDVVSRIRKNQGALGRWLGLHYNRYDAGTGTLAGPSVQESPTRSGVYEIFDRTRTVAMGRAPGVGPATWQPQPVGQVTYSIPRFHEKIRLDSVKLSDLRSIGKTTVLDAGGQQYIAKQEEYIASRFNNVMEAMIASLLRGKLYFKNVGEDWIPTFTQPTASVNPYVSIDWKLPAGNQAKLNMLGAGDIIGTSWDNAAAPILSNDLPKIMLAYAQLTGYVPTDVWVDPLVWQNIIKNTEVKNAAGSAARTFDEFKLDSDDPSTPYAQWYGVLRGYPTLRWHILAEYLVLDGGTDPTYAAGTGTLTPVIPANTAVFMPPVSDDWIDGIWYGEHVSEQPGQAMKKVPAWHMWSEWITQPTAVELIGLMNMMPRLRIPKALAVATVVF